MTEKKNLERVREALRRFGEEGDPAGLIDAFAEDVELVSRGPAGAVPWAGTYRGKKEAVAFIEAYDAVEYETFEPQEFIASGDTVVVQGRERWKAKASGRSCDNEWTVVFHLRNGQITHMRVYEDTAAVAQATAGWGLHRETPAQQG